MRLDCPNCATGYEVPEGMIPPGGRHVQCTECHTRWFVRGRARPVLTEEQIITRLEARTRPRPVPVPDPEPELVMRAKAGGPPAEEVFVWEDAEEIPPDAPSDAPPVTPAAAPAAEPASPPPAAAPGGRHRPVVVPAPAPRPGPAAAAPAPPAADAPGPAASGKPAGPPPAAAGDPLPSRPAAAPIRRPAARLDLTGDGASRPAPTPVRSRFAWGLLLALAVFGLALAVYRAHAPIAAGVPVAAPALEAYVGAIDAVRHGVAARFAADPEDG